MVNKTRNRINRHRTSTFKFNVTIKNKLRFRRNSDYTSNRRILFYKITRKSRQSGKFLRQMPKIQTLCIRATKFTSYLTGEITILVGASSKLVTKNALPILAYYDIFKNYYANTQEENFYIIGQYSEENTAYELHRLQRTQGNREVR